MLPPFDTSTDDTDTDTDTGTDAARGDEPPDQPEECTARDGFLSSSPEWHALTHGLYLGVVTKPWAHPPEPRDPDVAQERHYYRGGYLLGTACQLLGLVVLGWVGVERGLGVEMQGPGVPGR